MKTARFEILLQNSIGQQREQVVVALSASQAKREAIQKSRQEQISTVPDNHWHILEIRKVSV